MNSLADHRVRRARPIATTIAAAYSLRCAGSPVPAVKRGVSIALVGLAQEVA
jgi:hypothetical protein